MAVSRRRHVADARCSGDRDASVSGPVELSREDVICELQEFARYCRGVQVDSVGPAYTTWERRAEWATRLADALASGDPSPSPEQQSARDSIAKMREHTAEVKRLNAQIHGRSPSLPAEPSDEAVNRAKGLLTERLFHVPARHVFDALRAAYRIDRGESDG